MGSDGARFTGFAASRQGHARNNLASAARPRDVRLQSARTAILLSPEATHSAPPVLAGDRTIAAERRWHFRLVPAPTGLASAESADRSETGEELIMTSPTDNDNISDRADGLHHHRQGLSRRRTSGIDIHVMLSAPRRRHRRARGAERARRGRLHRSRSRPDRHVDDIPTKSPCFAYQGA